MIKAGVLDEERCIESMREAISLYGKGDFLQGGPKGDEHGLQVNFPYTSDIPGFPLDNGPDRRMMAMPAYLGGRFHIAGQKFYGSNTENLKQGLPRSILMVSLIDVDTGAPIAYMSANLLSAMRTGAMPAMAATYLANKDAESVSIIGPGAINRMAFNCLMHVLPGIHVVKLKGSTPTSRSAQAFADFIREQYPQVDEITICATQEEASRDVDVVLEAMSVDKNDMEEFRPEWFKPGCTVFSLGQFYYTAYEQLGSIVKVVDNYGMYRKYMDNFNAIGPVDSLGRKRRWGAMGMNFVHAVDEGIVPDEEVYRLADLIDGRATARKSHDDVVFCSIGGMPIEDLAWGYDCYCKARELGVGTTLRLWDTPYLR